MPRPLYPRGKNPRYPLGRKLSGSQSRSGHDGGEKFNHCPCRDPIPVRLSRSQVTIRTELPREMRRRRKKNEGRTRGLGRGLMYGGLRSLIGCFQCCESFVGFLSPSGRLLGQSPFPLHYSPSFRCRHLCS
jgi:hypothetical protein